MSENSINFNPTDFIAVVKVLHFIDGVKVWYFLSNLDFDWALLRSLSMQKWPSMVYLANRFTSIACAVSFLVGLNITSRINCQAWISIAFVFPLVELELALILIVVRVIAIWGRSNTIISLTTMALTAHSVVSLYMLSGIHSFYDPGPYYTGCVVYAPQHRLLVMSVTTIILYSFLLLAMLFGLLRLRSARSFRLWHMLRNQGWIWFALAVAAEVPTLMLVVLNISPSFNLLLQVPRVVIASIGTTFMYRALSRYGSNSRREPAVYPGRLRTDSNFSSEAFTWPPSSPPPGPILTPIPLWPPPQLEVSVHTTTIDFCDSQIAQKSCYDRIDLNG